LKRNCNC